jgi:hypothetical protein
LFWLSCPVCAVLSWLSCPSFPIPAVLLLLSCPGYPELSFKENSSETGKVPSNSRE